jgi:hypothetical protein
MASLVCLAVPGLVGCGEKGQSASRQPDSFLGKSCAVEIEFDRAATERQIEVFRMRVEAVPGVMRVELLGRKQVIERFTAALGRSGYKGDEFIRLAARARRFAGAALVATPRRKMDVPHIVTALQDLPEAVASVIDRPSCDES